MFNVWLPSVLESRQPDGEGAIKGALSEYVLYAVAGCPGSIVSTPIPSNPDRRVDD